MKTMIYNMDIWDEIKVKGGLHGDKRFITNSNTITDFAYWISAYIFFYKKADKV